MPGSTSIDKTTAINDISGSEDWFHRTDTTILEEWLEKKKFLSMNEMNEELSLNSVTNNMVC